MQVSPDTFTRNKVKAFWEEKILAWEDSRYRLGKPNSFVEHLAGSVSQSLRFRQTISAELLRPHIQGKRIVELGCASGLLAPTLIAAGALSYRGYDLAENAIVRAKKNADLAGITGAASFYCAALRDIPPLECDLVLSLGFLDWLDDFEIVKTFSLSPEADFFHSFSERRFSLLRGIHRLYTFGAYGHRSQGYTPRYLDSNSLLKFVPKNKVMNIYRNRRLGFGAILSSLTVTHD